MLHTQLIPAAQLSSAPTPTMTDWARFVGSGQADCSSIGLALVPITLRIVLVSGEPAVWPMELDSLDAESDALYFGLSTHLTRVRNRGSKVVPIGTLCRYF
jgi:hypothetical protein